MADSAEVCGCNGVSKGTIVKAIKEHGLFTLDDVRSTPRRRRRADPAPASVEQILASCVGGAYQPADSNAKPVCGCTDLSHGKCARRSARST
jgi:nitrite reductase (NADH) large subunit